MAARAVIKVKQEGNVGFGPLHHNTLLAAHLTMVLSHFNMFIDDHGLLFTKVNSAEVLGDMISSDLLHGWTASAYIQ